MSKKLRPGLVPLFAAGLLGLTAAGCSSYGAGDYGYYGRPYLGTAYGAPYSYRRGPNYAAPHNYDHGRYSSRGAGYRAPSAVHSGSGHLGGRRH